MGIDVLHLEFDRTDTTANVETMANVEECKTKQVIKAGRWGVLLQGGRYWNLGWRLRKELVLPLPKKYITQK